MSSAADSDENAALLAVPRADDPAWRLERAYRAVLSDAFGDAIRNLVEDSEWYAARMSDTELFRFWVRDNVESCQDEEWLFKLIRPTERKFLCDHLGIERSAVVGKSPGEYARILLTAVGLPAGRPRIASLVAGDFDTTIELALRGEDERAATLVRQKSERLLRTLAFFYSRIPQCDSAFFDVVKNPDKLRIHARLAKVTCAPEIAPALVEDGWADMGFLALYVRKVSAEIERRAILHPRGTPLVLLTGEEHKAITDLSTALQPYTHDRNMPYDVRRRSFVEALRVLRSSLEAMLRRDCIPEEMVVLECCESLFGPTMAGRLGDGTEVVLTTDTLPPVGSHLLLVRAARRRHARCYWAPFPWPRAA